MSCHQQKIASTLSIENGGDGVTADDMNQGATTAQHKQQKDMASWIASPNPISWRGSDTDGQTYESIEDMWKVQSEDWYQRAADYYEENCPPTVDGVLGGYASISTVDLEGSRQFLQSIQEQGKLKLQVNDEGKATAIACECGAGIGRVSKHLLLPLGVQRCDLVESSARLLSAAPEYLGDADAAKCRFYCRGLQDWEPPTRTYTIIWIQWVLCYLTDVDVVAFLRRCGQSLVPDGGMIVLKENTTCTDEAFVVDTDDASITRSLPYLRKLIQEADLEIVLETMQSDFPDDLFPVPMLALGVKHSS